MHYPNAIDCAGSHAGSTVILVDVSGTGVGIEAGLAEVEKESITSIHIDRAGGNG